MTQQTLITSFNGSRSASAGTYPSTNPRSAGPDRGGTGHSNSHSTSAKQPAKDTQGDGRGRGRDKSSDTGERSQSQLGGRGRGRYNHGNRWRGRGGARGRGGGSVSTRGREQNTGSGGGSRNGGGDARYTDRSQTQPEPEKGTEGTSKGYYWPATIRPASGANNDDGPFVGWSYYFPRQSWETCSFIPRINQFVHFFTRHYDMIVERDIYEESKCCIDFAELMEYNEADAPSAEEISEKPDKILPMIGLAIHQVVHNYFLSYVSAAGLQKIEVVLYNYTPMTSLRTLTSSSIGRFVSIKGTVVRVSNIKPRVTCMTFSCTMCGESQAQLFTDGTYEVPQTCATFQCKGKKFEPERTSADTVTTDYQTIRIQEMVSNNKKESGRIPRTIECELSGCMLDTVTPGDIVHATGEVKVTSVDEGAGRKKNKSAMYLLYISINSVTSTKTKTSNKIDSSSGFSMPDLYGIEEIQTHEQLFRLLVHSISPSIYGHEMIKAGLVLALFASGQKFADDKNRIPIRGGTHVLIVGDPGLGKSQMLQAVSDIAPRSVYVCGNTATAAGLTVSLVRDGSGSGDYALEAGALVLADQGCCCIDEFDKMGTDHQSLLEAMEQQSISIAKAGIVCTLPARTSIIAAANPIGGHYNTGRTVCENLKLPAPLLSRFDLIFILLDKPDEEMDQLLSEHVLSLHSRSCADRSQSIAGGSQQSGHADEDQTDFPLKQRLKKRPGEDIDHIPAALLRKYVAYARQFVEPTLSPEACAELKAFYIGLRESHQSVENTPITTRQLESLIRLSEARARSELREVVTKDDALDAIEIMRHSLFDGASMGDDIGLGMHQTTSSASMAAASKSAQRKKLVAHLTQVAHTAQNALFTIQQLRSICGEIGLSMHIFDETIDALNSQGFLLKKGARVYQIACM